MQRGLIPLYITSLPSSNIFFQLLKKNLDATTISILMNMVDYNEQIPLEMLKNSKNFSDHEELYYNILKEQLSFDIAHF